MLSNTSRYLTYLTAVLYAILGAMLFAIPEQLAPVFAWKVTAFMTMTIGGWCLGNAWLAFFAARRWKWEKVFTSLLYLGLFGIGELLVLYFFREKLSLKHPIAWLYLITLLANVALAVFAFTDLIRMRPQFESPESKTSSLIYALLVLFIIFVGYLGVYGCIAQIGWPATNGEIFPEVMSLFTLRSFGVFYLCIALAVTPFLKYRSWNAILNHGFLSYGLIIFITAAAVVYIRLFDFAAHPGGLLYFGAYLAVGAPLLFVFWKHGTGS